MSPAGDDTTEQGSPVAKSARNWRGTSDLTPSIRPIGGGVCHFDAALSPTDPGSTVMQNRDTNLESRYDCHSHRRQWGATRGTRESRDSADRDRNRTESMFPSGATRAMQHEFFVGIIFFHRFLSRDNSCDV